MKLFSFVTIFSRSLVEHDDGLDQIARLVAHEEQRLLQMAPTVEHVRGEWAHVQALQRSSCAGFPCQAAAGHQAALDALVAHAHAQATRGMPMASPALR